MSENNHEQSPHDPNRRGALKTVIEYAIAGLIGKTAIDLDEAASKAAKGKADQVRQAVIERLIGSQIEIPVWTGEKLVGVEFDFAHAETGYVLTARRIVCDYKHGDECAKRGLEMVKIGLALMEEKALPIEVDMKGLKLT
jgi:hypothetical protein